jgi:hypothetical protein
MSDSPTAQLVRTKKKENRLKVRRALLGRHAENRLAGCHRRCKKGAIHEPIGVSFKGVEALLANAVLANVLWEDQIIENIALIGKDELWVMMSRNNVVFQDYRQHRRGDHTQGDCP